jgi:hypothetical protein
MGEMRGVYNILEGKPECKSPLGRTDVDGRIILREIFRKLNVGVWTGSNWLSVGTVGEHL